jgi:hypothetical protein
MKPSEALRQQSEQVPKLFDGKPGIANNTAHSKRIHGIMTRDRHDPLTIAHDDVLTLAHDPKPGLFECAHRVKMVDAGDLGQG